MEKQIAAIEFKSRVAGALRKGSEAQRSLKRLKFHTFTMSFNKTGGRYQSRTDQSNGIEVGSVNIARVVPELPFAHLDQFFNDHLNER